MKINNKEYPMWGQFIENKSEWIGGTLQEVNDSFPRVYAGEIDGTIIADIDLRPNGTDSAYFEVKGEKYSCGGDVEFLGITAGDEGWITLSGYGGHRWRIKKPTK